MAEFDSEYVGERGAPIFAETLQKQVFEAEISDLPYNHEKIESYRPQRDRGSVWDSDSDRELAQRRKVSFARALVSDDSEEVRRTFHGHVKRSINCRVLVCNLNELDILRETVPLFSRSWCLNNVADLIHRFSFTQTNGARRRTARSNESVAGVSESVEENTKHEFHGKLILRNE